MDYAPSMLRDESRTKFAAGIGVVNGVPMGDTGAIYKTLL